MSIESEKKRKKAMLIKALKQSLGLISPACEAAGISRQMFYIYMKDDPEFKREVEEIDDYVLDYVENQLFKKIKEGSEKSIHFHLRNKGKKRGYGDNLDITTNGKDITEIKLIEIKNREDDDEKINE